MKLDCTHHITIITDDARIDRDYLLSIHFRRACTR